MGGAEVRRVVVIFKVEVPAVVPLGVTETGEAAQVVCAGNPLHEITTPELKPPKDVTFTVRLVEFPATTVAEVGLTETPKSPPPPINETTCGLLGALSVTVKLAVRVPAAEGVKVTLIVQDNPTPKVAPQLLLWEKSVLFVPVTPMLMPVMVALPEFVSKTDWEGLVVFSV